MRYKLRRSGRNSKSRLNDGNKIIHGGTIVGKKEAEEAYAAATAFVAHLRK
jgi:hypothetical protein